MFLTLAHMFSPRHMWNSQVTIKQWTFSLWEETQARLLEQHYLYPRLFVYDINR